MLSYRRETALQGTLVLAERGRLELAVRFNSLSYVRMGVNRITYRSQGVASLPHKCQPPSPPLDNIRLW